MRAHLAILGAAAALLAPQAARAAELAPLAGCYRSLDAQNREQMPVYGTGFTPGEKVNVYIDGTLVRENVDVLDQGEVNGQVQSPYQPRGERSFTLTVTEIGRPSNTASATSRVTALGMRMKPRSADLKRRVRFIGRGFSDGPMVYAHYVRKGKLRRTVRLGAPQGACGRISVKRRQFPMRNPAKGRWIVQFDNQPTYSAVPVSVVSRIPITVSDTPRRD